jgi:putative flippase GtrA
MVSKRSIAELVRFGFIGGAGFISNLLLLILLVELLFIPEYLAAIISAILVLLGTFLATNKWVFKNSQTKTKIALLKRGVGYYTIMLIAKAINYIIYVFLLSIDVWYPIAWIIGSVFVFAGTFILNRSMWNRI